VVFVKKIPPIIGEEENLLPPTSPPQLIYHLKLYTLKGYIGGIP